MATRKPTRPSEPHAATAMVRRGVVHFSGRSYSDQFLCPVCGRRQRQNLSFLGRRRLLCVGTRSCIEQHNQEG